MKIETDRLLLRQYTLNDAPFIQKLMNSEGWLKNIGDRNIKTVEDAQQYIAVKYLPIYEKYKYGPYLVSLKESEIPIGSAGLYKRVNLEHPDIGFAFLPDYWNKGYAFEAADAILQFALKSLNIQKIVGISLPDNFASINVLKKLGFSEVGNYTYEDGENLLLFSN